MTQTRWPEGIYVISESAENLPLEQGKYIPALDGFKLRNGGLT
jgi:hypothetical protein